MIYALPRSHTQVNKGPCLRIYYDNLFFKCASVHVFMHLCVCVSVRKGFKNSTVYWFISTRLAMLMTWTTTQRLSLYVSEKDTGL